MSLFGTSGLGFRKSMRLTQNLMKTLLSRSSVSSEMMYSTRLENSIIDLVAYASELQYRLISLI